MAFIRVVFLCVACAVAYGIVHDQVTVRVCVEYFTVGHPRVFPTDSPTLLALGWGVLATWWVGLILGAALGLSARLGRRPKLEAGRLAKPLLDLMLVVACLAVVAGLLGYRLALADKLWLVEPVASKIPKQRHAFYIADLWAHGASYATGVLGGIVLCVLTWLRRRKMPVLKMPEDAT